MGTPRDDLGRKVLESVWNYVKGDYASLLQSATPAGPTHRVPLKTTKKPAYRRKNKILNIQPKSKNNKKKNPFLKRPLSPKNTKETMSLSSKVKSFVPSAKVKSFIPATKPSFIPGSNK